VGPTRAAHHAQLEGGLVSGEVEKIFGIEIVPFIESQLSASPRRCASSSFRRLHEAFLVDPHIERRGTCMELIETPKLEASSKVPQTPSSSPIRAVD